MKRLLLTITSELIIPGQLYHFILFPHLSFCCYFEILVVSGSLYTFVQNPWTPVEGIRHMHTLMHVGMYMHVYRHIRVHKIHTLYTTPLLEYRL